MTNDLVERLRALHVWPQVVADDHADLLTPRRIDKLYEVGRVSHEAADLIETQAREIERLRERVERIGRDKETLLTFARAIQTWRSDADSYDEECDHPQRDYCEDVELMEKAAGYALRRIAERAALAGDSHD